MNSMQAAIYASLLSMVNIMSGHVQSMRRDERVSSNKQHFFVRDIDHLKFTLPSGVIVDEGHVYVPLNKDEARDDFTLLYEEYVGLAAWYKPMDLLEEKRNKKIEELKLAQAQLDKEKNKTDYDDYEKRIKNHEKVKEKYAQLKAGSFKAAGTTPEILHEMFEIAQRRDALRYIETNHPEALAPFITEETFASVKAVGDLGVNLATDFVPIIKQEEGKDAGKYAFVLGDRPDKIFKCTLGGMDEGGALNSLLRELTEELSSKDLFAKVSGEERVESPSYRAFKSYNVPMKTDFLAVLNTTLSAGDNDTYDLSKFLEQAGTTKVPVKLLADMMAHLENIKEPDPRAEGAAALAKKIKSAKTQIELDFLPFINSLVSVNQRASYGLEDYFINADRKDPLTLLGEVITHLEAIPKDAKNAHTAHELALNIKIEVDKKYFAKENAKLKSDLIKALEQQPIKAMLGDDRSGPCAVMRTIPWYGYFTLKGLKALLLSAHKTICGGDDLLNPSIINIDDVDYDRLFAEHASLLMGAIAWLYKLQVRNDGEPDPVLMEQIENIKRKNPKLAGVLDLCGAYTTKHRHGQGDLFTELSSSMKLLLAYQALPDTGHLSKFNLADAIQTLDLYLWNRPLATTNDQIIAPMAFDEAVTQVLAAVKQLKGELNLRSDEWLTRKQLATAVQVKVLEAKFAASSKAVADNPAVSPASSSSVTVENNDLQQQKDELEKLRKENQQLKLLMQQQQQTASSSANTKSTASWSGGGTIGASSSSNAGNPLTAPLLPQTTGNNQIDDNAGCFGKFFFGRGNSNH